MIAADTSVLVAYLKGQTGGARLDRPIESGDVVISPVVLTELLSSPRLSAHELTLIGNIPLIPIQGGYWVRAGQLRAQLVEHGLKASIADTLIAQSCIDHDVPLITLDRDFRHYVRFGGLRIAS
jgi:hypothetical protein